MKQTDDKFTIDEVERLCQLYQDCRLTVLEETELEYVMMHCDFDTPVIEETKKLMAISRSIKLVETKKPHKLVWTWAMRVAASVAIMFGTVAVFHQISLQAVNENCIVYVSGEKASAEVAREIAEADVAKMQHFMQVVSEQKATEEAKVKQFMNHINQSK